MKQSYKSIIIGYTQALAEYYNSWTNFLREVNNENFIIKLPRDQFWSDCIEKEEIPQRNFLSLKLTKMIIELV